MRSYQRQQATDGAPQLYKRTAARVCRAHYLSLFISYESYKEDSLNLTFQ